MMAIEMINRSELQAVRSRLDMVGHLIDSCIDVLEGWAPAHRGEEIARRDIERAVRGVIANVLDLGAVVVSSRIRLAVEDCPHCAWPLPPSRVPRCPRCNAPREVRREVAGGPARCAS